MGSKALLRSLYLRVHPDLFEKHPAAQRVNEASFKVLQALLNQQATVAPTLPSAKLHFFVDDSDAGSTSAGFTDGSCRSGGLRSVEVNVRAGQMLTRDLERLVRGINGEKMPPADIDPGASSMGGNGRLSTRYTQEPWWRGPSRQAADDTALSLEALLLKYGEEARRRAAAAEAAEAELLAELAAARRLSGVRIAFDPRLRCVRTKRRLWRTLQQQLFPQDEEPAALHGCTVRFTDADPFQAASASDKARMASSSAEMLPTLFLSTQDTAFGWRHALRAHSDHLLRDQTVSVAPSFAAAEAPSSAYAASRAPSSPVFRATWEGRPATRTAGQEAAAPPPMASASSAAAASAAAHAAEQAATHALFVRSVFTDSESTRMSAEYIPFLHGLLPLRPQLHAAWGACGAARDGWRVLVTTSRWSALREPSLQPQLLQVKLPLGSQPMQLVHLLNGRGSALVLANAASREMICRCKAELQLRSLTADDTLSPDEVLRACRGLLGRKRVLEELGAGTRLHLTEFGGALLEDGTLSIGWGSVEVDSTQ